jgi:Domain of Unknown Function (DUF1543)
MNLEQKLFACYVGGRIEGCNIELHDIIFAVGTSIEDTYPQIKAQWFGSELRLHLDCYIIVDSIDGWDVSIGKKRNNVGQNLEQKLFLINLGGYREGFFGEVHCPVLTVAKTHGEAITNSKSVFFEKHLIPHIDDKVIVDDLIEIDRLLPNHSILLTKQTTKKPNSKPIICGYQKIN